LRRSPEHRKLQEQGEEALNGSKFLFLFEPEKLGSKPGAKLRDLLNSDLKVARASTLKEQFRDFLGTCQCAYGSELLRGVVGSSR
jgi:Transposase